ncbi:hypothetical protein GIB67_034356 [Kingdonia uniflora]|uniref:Uncharacterized protein n=1 Tax=Kingdonia uniflora TaxID=39325 RepID=A0A7J7NSK5_9MAGN|nr:hypothetical protein GIB67_034356 [Kingdonia uniflora]
MMSMLVVEIFDRHLADMKFQFGGTIIQMKPIYICLILELRVSHIANEFLFVDPEYITNFRMRRFPKKKNIYGLKEIDGVLKQTKLGRHYDDVLRLNLLKIILFFLLPKEGRNVEVKYVDLRNHIEAPVIGIAPAIGVVPAIGIAPTIEPLVVGALAVGAPTIGSSSSATEIGSVVDKVYSQLEVHGKMLQIHGKMLKRILMFTVRESTLPLGDGTLLLGQYQFSTPKKTAKRKREEEEKKKVKGQREKAEEEHGEKCKFNANKKNKKAEEADVPLKKKVEGTKIKDLTDEQLDHVPLIQFKTLIPKIPKKGLVMPREKLEVVKDLMVNDDVEVKKEVNLEAISSKYCGSLLETMVVAEVAKTDIAFFNQEEVIGEAYQTKESKKEVKQSKEEAVKGNDDDDDGNSQKKPNPVKFVLMESEGDVTLKKRHTLTDEDINDKAFSLACQMNLLHAHIDEFLPGVLFESFIQRPISQDEKNQVYQV